MAVIDTGMGIRQDDMKYLFDSFKRVNEGSTKGIEGTIDNVGRLGKDGMKETNEEIIRIMIND